MPEGKLCFNKTNKAEGAKMMFSFTVDEDIKLKIFTKQDTTELFNIVDNLVIYSLLKSNWEKDKNNPYKM